MTRRFDDISRPRPAPLTIADLVTIALALVIAAALGAGLIMLLFSYRPAAAHESWINRGGYKNSAGEWCCGDHDCKTYQATGSSATGWLVGNGSTIELVPYDEAMPVAPPDGLLTICRRPDGTRRCVFGIKPGL